MASSPGLARPPSYQPVDWNSPEGQPQIVIINPSPTKPRRIRDFKAKSKSSAVRFVRGIKNASQKWFSHIILLIMVFLYSCLGAACFQLIEKPDEKPVLINIKDVRYDVLVGLRTVRMASYNDNTKWKIRAHDLLKEYESKLFAIYAQGGEVSDDWSFWSSMFFCGTVFTTIGYGNIAPTTTSGRAVFMIYAIIGIPLLLMVLADLGKLFTRAIKVVFFQIRRFYYTGKCKKARRMGRRATAVPVEYMAIAWKSVPNPRGKRGSHDINPESGKGEKQENGIQETAEAITTVPVESETNKPNIDIDDEFNLPVSVALILLIAYMMLGALIFTLWEEWSFFEAFYFVFVSMSTIGFGDFVPEHPMFMMASFIYLLFGLALTSMCINVVQEKLSEIFELAKMRIGTTVGFDLRNGQMDGYGEFPDGQGSKASTRRGSARSSPTNETDIDVPYSKESTKSPSPYKDTPPRMSPNYNAIQRESTSSPVSESGKT